MKFFIPETKLVGFFSFSGLQVMRDMSNSGITDECK